MRLDEATCTRLFGAAAVARMATTGPNGPHIVPIVFALDGERLVTMVDAKPKTTRRLQRLRNIESDQRVSVLVDHFDTDWTHLWWVRANGEAVVQHDGADVDRARALLAAKYSQYRSSPPPGPLITVTVERWSGWAASARAVRNGD